MNKTLKELEEIFKECLELGYSWREDMKDVTLQVFDSSRFEVSYNMFGEKWTHIEYHPRTGFEITSYGHLVPEQIIVAKVIPILKEILEVNKVSTEEKRVARIATLRAEKERIEKELESLSRVDGKEVESE